MRHRRAMLTLALLGASALFFSAAAAAAPDTLEEANKAFQGKDFAAAAKLFGEATQAAPDNGEAWYGLAQSLHQLKKYEAALEAYDHAAELGFQLPRTFFHAARAAASQGDAEAAIAYLNRMADAGGRAYRAVEGAAEFKKLHKRDEFQQALNRLKPCASPEYRHFDFWVGDWEVSNPSGKVVGHNHISSLYGGCVLREEYDTPGAYAGTSINLYDAKRGQWHQTWMDNQGQALHLWGGLQGEAMVLQSEPDADGNANRITWTPLEDGRVRQLWESSSDGGGTWTVAFDGYYKKK